ncbi:uncharacterized protein [Euphorbia lathyris]|uniref:uncharacterized protein isoform X3 n=1 Tax=Euphorbia lathyris TaxID=212925 RepID=UPI003313A10D
MDFTTHSIHVCRSLLPVQVPVLVTYHGLFQSAACRTLGVGFSKASVGIQNVYEKPNWGYTLFNARFILKVIQKRSLRAGGIKGPSYNFFHANTKDIVKIGKEAMATSMELSDHQVFYEVQPHFYYGPSNMERTLCSG